MYSSRYQFVGPDQFTKEMLATALELDQENYDRIDQGNDLCYLWKQKNPEVYFGVVDKDNNCLIAYINALPLSLDTIKNIFSKKIRDVDLTPHLVQTYEESGVKHLYLTSIVIEDRFQGSSVIRVLVNGFLDYIYQMAEKRGIYFEGIYSNAVSQQGLLLARRFNFKAVTFSKKSHCFRLSLIPFGVKGVDYIEFTLKEAYSKKTFKSIGV